MLRFYQETSKIDIDRRKPGDHNHVGGGPFTQETICRIPGYRCLDHTIVIVTVDGKVYTGTKQQENKDELILRDAEGNDIKIPLKNIEKRG